jgi:hypothetical protein
MTDKPIMGSRTEATDRMDEALSERVLSEPTATLHEIPSPPEREDGEIPATETATIRTFKQRVVEFDALTGGSQKVLVQLIALEGGRVEIRSGPHNTREEHGLLPRNAYAPIVDRAEFYRAQHVVADIADD